MLLYLEYQLFPELLGDLVLGHEEVHQALDHVGGGTLPRLGPKHHQYHCRSVGQSLSSPGHHKDRPPLDLPALLVCHALPGCGAISPGQEGRGDGDHLQPPLLDTLAERLPRHDVRVLGHQLVQVGLAPRVGVGVAEGELVSLLIGVEGKGEGEDIVVAVIRRLVVVDVGGGDPLPEA